MLNRIQRTRQIILRILCDTEPVGCDELQDLTTVEWERLLYWLDTSGLALYFFDRVQEPGQGDMLPAAVFSRLRQNLIDNTQRMQSMMDELSAIHHSFRQEELSYAVLKGVSLWPISVPKLELRSQLDIDLLLAEECAPVAATILKSRGYRLHAISGKTWEFKAGFSTEYSIKNLYKTPSVRVVEVHLESRSAKPAPLLPRAENVNLAGMKLPSLSPLDIFLWQGLHLYKHVCGPASRTAHHIEFRRHIVARYHDHAFWSQLREAAEKVPGAAAKLGLATLLITHVMGEFAPATFTCWTMDRLPDLAHQWVEMYGYDEVLGSGGDKLYLLLQQAMEQVHVPAPRSLRKALLPITLPPSLFPATPGETIAMRGRRYRMQAHLYFSRLKYHLVGGIQFLYESVRWQQEIKRRARVVPRAIETPGKVY